MYLRNHPCYTAVYIITFAMPKPCQDMLVLFMYETCILFFFFFLFCYLSVCLLVLCVFVCYIEKARESESST